ncbi:DUF805 domain-containing protein [Tichowtungia aerotolerans]|uniref:DUF805 domain-containing protein n=1 Tax=Tichowtungia aerotolerans TaxID=2697043 RepID=A0A6P1MEG2_9BACT|nr:DUF805 domain-containing protein [Tichowtungia aerotolerans]QHI69475.1 DUF805 domain-containing protein [Tichowtungia aerotolerans]
MKPFLNIFTFTGEASRSEWWCVYIGVWALWFVLAQVDTVLNGAEETGSWFVVVYLVSFWPLWTTQVRRWHDRGKSGLWCLINFIPVIGSLWAFIELGFFQTKEDDDAWMN